MSDQASRVSQAPHHQSQTWDSGPETRDTISTTLHWAIERLAPIHDTARLDAEVLLAFALGRLRSYLHAWPERELGPDVWNCFRGFVERRCAGEPIAYITGRREFWSLDLAVTRDTLIPRPETELLVELALQAMPEGQPVRVADIGTGTGAIALAIASERPQSTVVATDISAAALQVAHGNALHLGIHNVEFREGDLCEPLHEEVFDIIVSNPPYVRNDDPHLVRGDVRFEPLSALAAGPRGLDAINRLATCACGHLAEGGWLLMEHGYDQAREIRRLLSRSGYNEVTSHRDGAGHERVISARR